IGSPAGVSSSTTEPCASCRMCLIGILVRPNSTVSCTGMSRIRLMSLPAPPLVLPPDAKLANCAGDSLVASAPTALRVGQQSIDLDGVPAAGGTVVAVEHRHAVDLGLDHRQQIALDEVAGF